MGLLNLFLGLCCAAACVPSSAARATKDGNILVRARYCCFANLSSALGQLLGSLASHLTRGLALSVRPVADLRCECEFERRLNFLSLVSII